MSALALPYPEHLSPTYGAYALSRWLAIIVEALLMLSYVQ